ncbi:MAG: alpha-amylase family glycosyl hydrolase [Telluria sp.]
MNIAARPLAILTLAFAAAAPNLRAEILPAQTHVAWSQSANIYEVNVRQYTKEGTLNSFAAHLPRLKKMGVDIIWLMPVQPIGEKNRKGKLGSYYAVRDYTAVNPEFGTMDDMKALVKQAHGLGMRVILDWVANHTAWDNPWVTQHNDWYKKNEKGEIYPVTFNEGPEPEYWTDVVALDYGKPEVWKAMTDAMAFWVREADIDGFRCDVAGLLPIPFWNQARVELDKIKPVFMLAEWAEPKLHERAFDMTYGWELADTMKLVAKGKADARELQRVFTNPDKVFPDHAYRMRFTNNHDFNSWQGSDTELYGPAFKAMAVLAATLPGMPLIYSGQESGLDKRLAFFEKDQIEWKNYPLADFYAGLLKLKKDNKALWNGQYGGKLEFIGTANDKVIAYRRALGNNRVTVIANVSGSPQKYTRSDTKAKKTLGAWSWTIETLN